MTADVQTDPADKLSVLYTYLRDNNYRVPEKEEEFRTLMANQENAFRVHRSLIANDIKVPEQFQDFYSLLNPGKKKEEPALPLGMAGLYQPPAPLPGPVGPLSNGSAGTGEPTQPAPVIDEPKFDDQADREKALANLDKQINQQRLDIEHPGLRQAAPITPESFQQKLPEQQSLDYYKAKQEANHARENLGIDEKSLSLTEHAGHMAGQFNKGVVTMATAFPKAVAIGAQLLDRMDGKEKPIEEYATYKAGQWLDQKATEIGITATNPKLENSFWESTVPSAFGSVLGLMLTGGVGGSEKAGMHLLNASPKLGAATVQASKELGTLLRSNMATSAGITQGVTEFEQAKQAGATDQDAFAVFLKNYAVGLTEVIPIAHALDRINQFSHGGVVKSLLNITVAGGKGALEEGTQEGVQQYLTNEIAQGSYDPKREGFQDVISSVGAGAFVGFMLPGIMTAMEHMTPAQKTETKQIIHDALLKQKPNESTKPEQKAAPGERGAVPKPEKQTESPKGSNEPGGVGRQHREEKTIQKPVSKPVPEVTSNEESKKPDELPIGGPIVSENPKETPLSPAVKGEQPEPNQGAAGLASPKGEINFITPKDIHALAKEAGLDPDSKEFKDKSKQLTGLSHLDDMTMGELTKVKDYINETKHAIQIESAGSVFQHPQEGVGEPGSQRERVEPVQQGTETSGAHQKEEPRTDFTAEEVDQLVNQKLTGEQFDKMVKLTTNKGNIIEMRAGLAHKDMVVQKRRLDRFIKCLGKIV